MITPTQHEKNEWSRLARYAYEHDRNDIGHRFSMAAALKAGESCTVQWFDALQVIYRAWLVFGTLPTCEHSNIDEFYSKCDDCGATLELPDELDSMPEATDEPKD
jgi:hypothetical protein